MLVGHSIGAVNVLCFLEQHDPETDGVFAGTVPVAASAHEVGYDLLAEFFAGGFDWERIRRFGAAPDDRVEVPEVVHLITELLG